MIALGITIGSRSAGGGGAPSNFAQLNTALASSAKSALWPVDTDYLFQNVNLTPVTADGHAVGFQFDSSKLGGAIPLDYIAAASNTFSDFTTEQAPWVDNGDGSWSIDGSQVSQKDLQVSYSTPNAWVYFTFTISGGPLTIYLNNSSPVILGNGTHTIVSYGSEVYFFVRAGSGTAATISTIERKMIPGLHRYQTTAAKRPAYKVSGGSEWLLFDKVNDVLTASITGSGSTNMTLIEGVMRTTTGAAMLASVSGAGSFFGAAENADASLTSSGAGSPTYEIDGVAVPGGTATTRDQLFTAWIESQKVRAQASSLNLSTWATISTGFFASYTNFERSYGNCLLDAAGLSGDYAAALALAQAYTDERIAA